jgi:hypothetical protein
MSYPTQFNGSLVHPDPPVGRIETGTREGSMTRGFACMLLALGLIGSLSPVCADDDVTQTKPISSLSYRGHENNTDSNHLVAVYPALVGTRLDDCQTCHTGGTVTHADRRTSDLAPCGYCHLLQNPDKRVVAGAPLNYEGTLNPYGLAYKTSGRDQSALRAIANLDSDGDTYANLTEVNDLRYPGDPASKPGQPVAPVRTFEMTGLLALEAHTQFLLMNTTKQQLDSYATYRGVTVANLLAAAGVDLRGVTGISVIAPDGYAQDIDLDVIGTPYPAGLYYAHLDGGSFDDPAQGFVEYPPEDQMPAGLTDGGRIPGEQWLLFAYERDGGPMDESYLDATTGRLEGEGPYRLVAPQETPGAPDRGSSYSPTPYGDGYDYDSHKDHNAGSGVRGAVAIRINPMPAGYEEFDWKNGGYALVDKRQVIIYGSGVTGE